jgi:hypothetical protein
MAAQPPPSTGGIPPTTSAPPQQPTATASATANRFPAAATPAPAPPPAAAAAQPFRPLNVKDALRCVQLLTLYSPAAHLSPILQPELTIRSTPAQTATSTASRSPSMIRQRVSTSLSLLLLPPLTLLLAAISVYDRFLTVRFLRVRRELHLAAALNRVRYTDHEGVQESGN